MSKKKKIPNMAIEAFLSAFRWFLIFLIINNGIWIISRYTSHGTNIKMVQDGKANTNYTQTITTPKTE